MATSGSTDFTMTRNEIIADALRLANVIPSGRTPSATQISEVSRILNRVVKFLQTHGARLWTVDEATQTLTASSQVTNNSTVYTCIRNHTATTADEPGVGANWSTYWRERGDSGAPAWVLSTSYTSIGQFSVASDTIGIQKIFIRISNTDHGIALVTKQDFFDLYDKSIESSRPSCAFVDMQLSPVVYLWPHPNDTSAVIHYLRERLLEDYDNASDNPDSPVRWIPPVLYATAAEVAESYGMPIQKIRSLRADAREFLDNAIDDDEQKTGPLYMESAY